jgi:hypothetical protein
MASKAVQQVQVQDGKDLKVLRCDSGGLFRIGYDGGGEVPADLQSLYTSPRLAVQAINAYLEKRK